MEQDLSETLADISAQDLVNDAVLNPNGFQFPQDQTRVQRMADHLANFGQDRLCELAVTACTNGTSIVWETYQ